MKIDLAGYYCYCMRELSRCETRRINNKIQERSPPNGKTRYECDHSTPSLRVIRPMR